LSPFALAGPLDDLNYVTGTAIAAIAASPLVSHSSAEVGRKPEHRRGIYSSWDKRWREATADAPKPELVVYYDEFRIGATRKDVDLRIRLASSASTFD
jgi:hypothetical protein